MIVPHPAHFAPPDIAAADRLIARFGRLAHGLIPGVPQDERTLSRLLGLASAANHLIASGEARHGLRADRLAAEANYASDKHIREQLDEPWVRLWTSLAIRLLIADRTPLVAEHMLAMPIPLRRDSNRIGLDPRRGVARIKPLLRLYGAGGTCQLVVAQLPLTTGTRFDRRAEHAEVEEIAKAEANLREPLAASLDGHVEVLLEERAELLQHVRTGAVQHDALFDEAGLDPRTVVDRAFPRLLILDRMPHGSPRVQGELYSRIVMPGDDSSIVARAQASGLCGIAACQLPATRPTLGPRIDVDPKLAAEFGITACPLDGAVVSAGEDRLYQVAWSGSGTTARYWRTFGMRSDDERAAALAQRAVEPWTRACMERADAVAPLGRVFGKSPAWRRTEYGLIALADAARVTAQRARRTREIAR